MQRSKGYSINPPNQPRDSPYRGFCQHGTASKHKVTMRSPSSRLLSSLSKFLCQCRTSMNVPLFPAGPYSLLVLRCLTFPSMRHRAAESAACHGMGPSLVGHSARLHLSSAMSAAILTPEMPRCWGVAAEGHQLLPPPPCAPAAFAIAIRGQPI